MTTWDTAAACKGMDGDLWFPTSYDTMPGRYQVAVAVQICARCPVQPACLQDAMDEEGGKQLHVRHGIRGGYTPAERFNGRRALVRAQARQQQAEVTA